MPDSQATPRIVLASSSPSRLSILRSAGVEPVVQVSGVDEDAAMQRLIDTAASQGRTPTPAEKVCHLAKAKANAVLEDGLQLGEGDVLIGGDSMLLLDGELQGKPHTAEETVRRWQQQRGKRAELITGHAIYHDGHWFEGSSATSVFFAAASDKDIEAYAASGEPWGCAGAFTLEALGGWFIDRIEGDPSSVIGLSLPLVRRALEHFGLSVSDFWNR